MNPLILPGLHFFYFYVPAFAFKQFRLLSLSEEEVTRLTGPVFRPNTIKAGSRVTQIADGSGAREAEIRTVTTPTFLVVHKAASSDFVNALLEALFADAELAATFQLISREESADWPALPLHPAAQEVFHPEGSSK